MLFLVCDKDVKVATNLTGRKIGHGPWRKVTATQPKLIVLLLVFQVESRLRATSFRLPQ